MSTTLRLCLFITLIFITLVFGAKLTGALLNAPQITVLHTEGVIHLLDLRHNRLFPLVENLGSTPVAFNWSPDGRKLVYTLLDLNRYSIFMLDVYTRKIDMVAERTLVTSSSAWSPDSTRLALLSPEFDICLYTVAQKMTRCLGLQLANFPAWTPDGEWLMISIAVGRDAGVYLVNPETAAIRLLDNLPPASSSPVWSPDGRYMAFAMVSPDSQIFIANPDGSRAHPMTSVEGQKTDLAWSPDSRQLIYTVETHRNRELHLIDLNTGENRAITDEPDSIEARPAWSPDGALLAYVRYTNGALDLYVMDGATFQSSRALISILSYNYAWKP